MTSSAPVVLSHRGGCLQCDVPAVGGWDGLEKLFQFLEVNYGARSKSRYDGPDARRWLVIVREQVLELHYEDPWGSLLVSPSPDSDALLREIADDLKRRLSGAKKGDAVDP